MILRTNHYRFHRLCRGLISAIVRPGYRRVRALVAGDHLKFRHTSTDYHDSGCTVSILTLEVQITEISEFSSIEDLMKFAPIYRITRKSREEFSEILSDRFDDLDLESLGLFVIGFKHLERRD